MKTQILLLFIALQGATAFAQDNWKTPYLTKSLSGQAINEVIVNTSGGSIAVSGAPGEQPRVEVYIGSNNGNGSLSKEEIKKRLDEDYDLTVDVNDGQLHATAKPRHSMFNWKRALSISFKIFVPANVATNLNTSGGSINLENLVGRQQFETSGGSLHLDKLTGLIKGNTSGGSIIVSNSKQDIDLHTSGGSIRASNCTGSIRLETSGGSLNLQDLKGNINASTSGGSINANNIDGEFVTGTSGGSINLTKLSCSLDASTSGGSFNAQFITVGKYVKVDVSAGHINLQLPPKQGVDLDLEGDRVSSVLAGSFSGTQEKDKVHGKFNGGGPLVTVRGSSRVDVSFN